MSFLGILESVFSHKSTQIAGHIKLVVSLNTLNYKLALLIAIICITGKSDDIYLTMYNHQNTSGIKQLV